MAPGSITFYLNGFVWVLITACKRMFYFIWSDLSLLLACPNPDIRGGILCKASGQRLSQKEVAETSYIATRLRICSKHTQMCTCTHMFTINHITRKTLMKHICLYLYCLLLPFWSHKEEKNVMHMKCNKIHLSNCRTCNHLYYICFSSTKILR